MIRRTGLNDDENVLDLATRSREDSQPDGLLQKRGPGKWLKKALGLSREYGEFSAIREDYSMDREGEGVHRGSGEDENTLLYDAVSESSRSRPIITPSRIDPSTEKGKKWQEDVASTKGSITWNIHEWLEAWNNCETAKEQEKFRATYTALTGKNWDVESARFD